jgi:energy-coupling factor transporter ATP-binding protein EcfA2
MYTIVVAGIPGSGTTVLTEHLATIIPQETGVSTALIDEQVRGMQEKGLINIENYADQSIVSNQMYITRRDLVFQVPYPDVVVCDGLYLYPLLYFGKRLVAAFPEEKPETIASLSALYSFLNPILPREDFFPADLILHVRPSPSPEKDGFRDIDIDEEAQATLDRTLSMIIDRVSSTLSPSIPIETIPWYDNKEDRLAYVSSTIIQRLNKDYIIPRMRKG